MTVISDRFTRAVDHARIAHAAPACKSSSIPYLYHLLGVAALGIDPTFRINRLHSRYKPYFASHRERFRSFGLNTFP